MNKNVITEHNLDEWLVRNVENDLNASEQAALQDFLQAHPEHLTDLEAYEKTVLMPDRSIVFADKSLLYRDEVKVVPMWKRPARWAVAAALALLLVAFWFRFNSSTKFNDVVTAPPHVEPKNFAQPQDSEPAQQSVVNKATATPSREHRGADRLNNHEQPDREKYFASVVTNRAADTLHVISTTPLVMFNVITASPVAQLQTPSTLVSEDAPVTSKPLQWVSRALHTTGKDKLAAAFDRYSRMSNKKIEISYNSRTINLHKTILEY